MKFAGGEFIDVPLLPEDGFQLNAAKIEAAITGRTKMIIINNPNNPSGAVYTREALEQIADLAIQYDLLVLSDEMYSRLVYEDAQFVSMASLPGIFHCIWLFQDLCHDRMADRFYSRRQGFD